MSKNQIIIALVVLCLVGTIWGSVQDKKSTSLERQLTAMKAQASAVAPAVDAAATTEVQSNSAEALAEIESLKSQNQTLLADAATLKGSVDSQKQELTSLKEELAESAGGSQAVAAMQELLDKRAADVATLEEAVLSARAAFDEKVVALVTAEDVAAGLENVKTTLANSVDAYSVQNQTLSVELEEYALRIQALEQALEERSKILIASGVELGRTKLNMNVLLSRIAAQNNSLEILEETRITLEKELAAKFLIIEDLQHQLSAQVIEEIVVPVPVVEEVIVIVEEEAAPEAPVVEEAVEGAETPAQ